MTTLLVTHPSGLDHLTPPGHPERPDRLRAVDQALSADQFLPLTRMLFSALPVSPSSTNFS